MYGILGTMVIQNTSMRRCKIDHWTDEPRRAADDDGSLKYSHSQCVLLNSRDKLIFSFMFDTSSDFEDELVDSRMLT